MPSAGVCSRVSVRVPACARKRWGQRGGQAPGMKGVATRYVSCVFWEQWEASDLF